jgi:K+-sensing histidine kinase KdpD
MVASASRSRRDGRGQRRRAGNSRGRPAVHFDRFYRSAKARALPGSGLGLAIVRRIADMHGGTVEAIPLRQGMKFRVSVPEIVVDRPTVERTPVRS